MKYISLVSFLPLLVIYFGFHCYSIQASGGVQSLHESKLIAQFKKACTEYKEIQKKIEKNKAKSTNKQWLQFKKELAQKFACLDSILNRLPMSARKKLHTKIMQFQADQKDLADHESHYDNAVIAQSVRMVDKKIRSERFVDTVLKMRAILGLPEETESAAAACTSGNHGCNHGAHQLPDQVRSALIQGKNAFVKDHCEKQKESLVWQNEDGLTPALQALSFNNEPLFEDLTQLEHQQGNASLDSKYSASNSAFGCIVVQNYPPCMGQRVNRSYFVYSPHYQSFSCYPFVVERNELPQFQMQHPGRMILFGLPAYRVTEALEARASKCSNVLAIDDCAEREKVNALHHEHQRRLPIVLSLSMASKLPTEMRDEILSYIENDFYAVLKPVKLQQAAQ